GAPLLEVRGLEVVYRVRRLGRWRTVRAVRGVDLDIAAGETLALVGESGSGKSTVTRAIARLVPVAGGTITFAGAELHRLRGAELRAAREHLQMVFQDPVASLDPVMTVGATVAEPLRNFRHLSRRDVDVQVARLFDMVGLPVESRHRYPREFSGG